MYRAQYKKNSPFETWITIGVYGTEGQAIAAASSKKKRGVLMVRVIDKKNAVIFSG